MEHSLTECQKILIDRYLDGLESKKDEMMFLRVGMGANSFGFEDEIMKYLDAHPDATLQELDEYAEQFFPELVVDGEEDD